MSDNQTTALARLWRWLRGPETCSKCRLLRVEARSVGCRCEWSMQDE